MNPLYLDIGNSFLKLAARNSTDWQVLFDGELNRFSDLCTFIKSRKSREKIILSSVRKDITQNLRESLSEQIIIEFTSSDIPSEMLDYKTPKTLGLDRFLVCLAAWKESGKQDVIVIDAGSACTVDFMTKAGVYSGGIIMPGVQIIKQTMRNKLPELPQVSGSIPDHWPGKSTMECIEWGVNGFFLMAIQGFIQKYREMAEDPEIYITGGNAREVIDWMRDEETLHYQKNLIWDGLEELSKIVEE